MKNNTTADEKIVTIPLTDGGTSAVPMPPDCSGDDIVTPTSYLVEPSYPACDPLVMPPDPLLCDEPLPKVVFLTGPGRGKTFMLNLLTEYYRNANVPYYVVQYPELLAIGEPFHREDNPPPSIYEHPELGIVGLNGFKGIILVAHHDFAVMKDYVPWQVITFIGGFTSKRLFPFSSNAGDS